jgi:hypothetical protein
MNQTERRTFLIDALLDEQPSYRSQIAVPRGEREQKQLLRSLMNIRSAAPISEEFASVQDAYLKEENQKRWWSSRSLR